MLRVEDLVKHFPVSQALWTRGKGLVHAVDGVSFEIVQGWSLGLVGESGCGKTTTGRLLARLLEPTSGAILFRDEEGALSEVTRIKGRKLKAFRRRAQVIFQDPYESMNPRRTVLDTVAEPLSVQGIGGSAERLERVEEMLDTVGLQPSSSFLFRYPHEPSGGQRQRVAIARALVIRPDIVVCDEPTSALDVSVQAQILNLLLDLRRELGLTLVLISHDLAVVEHMANRIAVMYLGRVVEEGTAEQVFDRPRHPYTKALLGSVLTPEPELGLPEVVLGATFPNPVEPPAGCVFHPRCPEFIEGTCDAAEPALLPVDDNVHVRCFRTESGPSS